MELDLFEKEGPTPVEETPLGALAVLHIDPVHI